MTLMKTCRFNTKAIPMLPLVGGWVRVRDGNAGALTLFKRHYSRRKSRDDIRNPKMVGPGEYIMLMTEDGLAMFVWRKFIDDSGQQGINCAVFRNEGPLLSSNLILSAEEFALEKWGESRAYTYVDPKKIKSTNPGYCFKVSGWSDCGKTKSGLIILEKNLVFY